ncbi:SpoIIIAH-like family protein [Thermoflavimicrobium dichotomicum]|uniref:Stage III sporulation protein AH n=1 Tax=Thermoflavimicrobium dichotomicum TaxID=46223 RepID=A0A1I3QC31_9BACL|nr:SpoIIIAH-like family protein [Thermoflavimicrobium dichotomicum]SFJ31255.1 stage III sporulation protein AH [Thermoflavimicrobium dichotomicum]
MQVNKQTVWLVTMLTLMVVLSAYYIATGPVEPAGELAKEKGNKNDQIQVDIKALDQPASTSKGKEALKGKPESDYLLAYQLQRTTLRGKMTEEYMKILSNPKSSKQQIKEAEQKVNQLTQLEKQENVLEELIRKEGYQDAVVIINDEHVDVIVQSENLSKTQAVKLISLVRQHMDVAANQISVAYVK